MEIYVSFQEEATYSSYPGHLSQWFPTRIHHYLQISRPTDLFWLLLVRSHWQHLLKGETYLGLLYRRFYRHSNEQLYLSLSLVRPHLEYAVPVWSPHLHKDITMLERTKQFASKMCTKTWDSLDRVRSHCRWMPTANSLPEDLEHLQKDVHELKAYASANYMTFNASGWKFMIVSRKKQHSHPNPSISLNGSPLEFTPTFKYLGLLISSDFSWSGHIDNICSKAKRIWDCYIDAFIGTRTSNFTSSSSGHTWSTLLRFGLPTCTKTLQSLRKPNSLQAKCVQKIGILYSYNELLDRLHLPTLAQRRLHLSLCFMDRIIHGLLYFPANIIVRS